LLPALLPLLILATTLPALAGFEESRSFAAETLTVNNLIGEIRVSGHAGSSFEVLVQVRGDDASPELIEVLTKDGASPELTIGFPIESERNYVYPALGAGSKTSFTFNKDEGGSWLAQLIGAAGTRRITIRGSGSGLEVWADVEIKVPHGSTLRVNHGAGEIQAADVRAHLQLDAHSGAIEVSHVEGDVLADTGSGHVTLTDVAGVLNVDTGSGHVELENCRGGKVLVDTGSGHVTLRSVETPDLVVDTGSGHVRALGIRADAAMIDTGSGEVELRLDRMGDGEYEVDTGSGRVLLALPADASADVSADTGSGGIHLDLDAPVQILHKEKDELRFRIGEGAARVVLDTGSGSIRIVRAD
jgi:hypothetical protein